MVSSKMIDRVLKYAGEWDEEYLNLTVHAIQTYETPKAAWRLIDEFLSKGTRGDFNFANPYSKKLLLAQLLPGLLNLLVDDADPDGIKVSCALVTFLKTGWNWPEGHIQFDIAKAKAQVRTSLAGWNYIGKFEAVTYQNELCTRNGKSGPLVSFHFHCIVWVDGAYSRLERLRKSLEYRFTSRMKSRVPQFAQIDTLEDAAQVLAYISKLPSRGKRVLNKGNGGIDEQTRKISYRSYHQMFLDMSKRGLYSMWLSGGLGARVLADARRKAAKEAKRTMSDRRSVSAAIQRRGLLRDWP